MKHLLRISIGAVLLLFGIVFFLTPIPLGFLFLMTGAVLLSPEIVPMQRLITWIETKDTSKGKYMLRLRTLLSRWFGITAIH